jgi:hypothetical protein
MSMVRSVVPAIVTVPTGTMMSASEGGRHRLTTARHRRWFVMTMMPQPGDISSGTPAMAATVLAQIPAALQSTPTSTRSRSPVRTSSRSTPVTRPPSTTTPASFVRRRTSAPCASASCALAATRSNDCTDASGTRNARARCLDTSGSEAQISSGDTSSTSTSAARHPSTNAGG